MNSLSDTRLEEIKPHLEDRGQELGRTVISALQSQEPFNREILFLVAEDPSHISLLEGFRKQVEDTEPLPELTVDTPQVVVRQEAQTLIRRPHLGCTLSEGMVASEVAVGWVYKVVPTASETV